MEILRPILNCLCCFHCTEDERSQTYSDERTHLLSDPVHSNSPALRPANPENLYTEYSQSLPRKTDQNVLSCLVQNTNTNMIDVGAMDSHNLEHQEYNDRIRLYSQRLQQQWNKIQQPGNVITGFLKDVPNPGFCLTKTPANVDIVQIGDVLKRSKAALIDIRIMHKEAIVVPFRIP